MKKEILAILTLIVLSACAVQQPQQSQQQAEQEAKSQFQGSYKIGFLSPLSGDAASIGLPVQQAVVIAVDEINEKGGINGRKLEVVYEDGKCNPKDANTATQKLVNVDKVKAIVGGLCSGETLGAAPITEANKVVIISPGSSSPDVTNAGDFVFRVYPSDAFAGVVASDYAYNDLGAKKAALLTETTDYAQGLRKVFKENFAKLGGAIAADETYNPDDTDFRTQITKIKASEPDVVYIVPQNIPKGILMIKQLREAGVKKQLLTAEVLLARNILKENAADMEGMIGVELKFDDKAPKTAALLQKYTQKTGQEAPFPAFMAGAYDIVNLLADAIAKHGYDSEKIRDYLYSVKGYEGAIGKITMDENGDPIMEYSVKQARNGEPVIIK
ncbi:ABC transporter substrate-binding protein [Candidatus Woesearchaeota archaeon]|nr:ABC transporter substrate-binding protein [Candidatus Woesearchaeota archaeon]